METILQLVQYLLHIDRYLIAFVTTYGMWTYCILFLIIFCETGLIILPFLPGDSLLFAAGAITANAENALNIHLLFFTLLLASILGNKLNYFVGRTIGPKMFSSQHSWLLNKKHLEETHQFYEKHGGKTIILARFMPIIRSFAPFVAGVGYMSVREFSFYNVISAVLWIGALLYAGYFFGNLPVIKDHFSLVIYTIIFISLLPVLVTFFQRKCNKTNYTS